MQQATITGIELRGLVKKLQAQGCKIHRDETAPKMLTMFDDCTPVLVAIRDRREGWNLILKDSSLIHWQ